MSAPRAGPARPAPRGGSSCPAEPDQLESGVTLYGIPNCDTVKRARAWLAERSVVHRFHDFKRDGVPASRLDAWLAAVGWERLLNRKGTAWRALDASVRDGVTDAAAARAVMLAQASTIKRPVVEWGAGAITVGFDADAWAARAQSSS